MAMVCLHSNRNPETPTTCCMQLCLNCMRPGGRGYHTHYINPSVCLSGKTRVEAPSMWLWGSPHPCWLRLFQVWVVKGRTPTLLQVTPHLCFARKPNKLIGFLVNFGGIIPRLFVGAFEGTGAVYISPWEEIFSNKPQNSSC